MPSSALCVGINRLSGFTERLAGAVNDAVVYGKIAAKYGLTPTLLVDKDATKPAILAALKAGLAQLSPGEWLLYAHAGHGTRVQGSEVVITYDPAWIHDGEIGDALASRPPDTFVCLIFDTCYSGGMLNARGLLAPPKTRLLDPTAFALKLGLPAPEGVTASRLGERAGKVPGTIFYAACGAGQLSYEANPGGQWRGWFSYNLAQQMAGGGAFGMCFIAAASAMALKASEFPQTPVFRSGTRGMAGKRLFK